MTGKAYCFEITSIGFLSSLPNHEIIVENRGEHSLEKTGDHLVPGARDKHSLHYSTHNPILYGVFMNLEIATLRLTTTLDSGDKATSSDDTQIGLWGERYGIVAGSAIQSNFFINDGSLFEQLENEERTFRKMSFKSHRFHLYGSVYSWGGHLGKILDNVDYPKKSGGALVVIPSIDQVTIDAGGPLIPASQQTIFRSDGGFSKGEFTALNVSLAVAHTVTFGGFYMSALVGGGVGRAEYSIVHANTSYKHSSASFKEHYLFSLGYSSKSWLAGCEYNFDSPEYVFRTMTLGTSRNELKAAIGMLW